ncbi:retinitis pigmentosa 1-like 1 protein [Anaeramoeba flamelloides]|uniref:Retinitis pigmentosa 1-like 1 protein n=1 Tax=Anaeramoeba flamelloides TaxID=1746091 RepID=A0AAV8AF07_9EUKA|nr:retinitis pigmentosa 1-like 1 protein [Anaeramoeba flamelloides]
MEKIPNLQKEYQSLSQSNKRDSTLRNLCKKATDLLPTLKGAIDTQPIYTLIEPFLYVYLNKPNLNSSVLISLTGIGKLIVSGILEKEHIHKLLQGFEDGVRKFKNTQPLLKVLQLVLQVSSLYSSQHFPQLFRITFLINGQNKNDLVHTAQATLQQMARLLFENGTKKQRKENTQKKQVENEKDKKKEKENEKKQEENKTGKRKNKEEEQNIEKEKELYKEKEKEKETNKEKENEKENKKENKKEINNEKENEINKEKEKEIDNQPNVQNENLILKQYLPPKELNSNLVDAYMLFQELIILLTPKGTPVWIAKAKLSVVTNLELIENIIDSYEKAFRSNKSLMLLITNNLCRVLRKHYIMETQFFESIRIWRIILTLLHKYLRFLPKHSIIFFQNFIQIIQNSNKSYLITFSLELIRALVISSQFLVFSLNHRSNEINATKNMNNKKNDFSLFSTLIDTICGFIFLNLAKIPKNEIPKLVIRPKATKMKYLKLLLEKKIPDIDHKYNLILSIEIFSIIIESILKLSLNEKKRQDAIIKNHSKVGESNEEKEIKGTNEKNNNNQNNNNQNENKKNENKKKSKNEKVDFNKIFEKKNLLNSKKLFQESFNGIFQTMNNLINKLIEESFIRYILKTFQNQIQMTFIFNDLENRKIILNQLIKHCFPPVELNPNLIINDNLEQIEKDNKKWDSPLKKNKKKKKGRKKKKKKKNSE